MRVIFVTDNWPWSNFIRWFTWSKYSHVGLLFSDDKIVDTTLRKGVSEKTLEHYLTRYKNVKICEVPNVDEAKVKEFAYSQIGKKYDWTAIVGFVARRDWTKEDNWFCSELVAVALHKGGVTVIRKEASRVTPEDILNSPLLS